MTKPDIFEALKRIDMCDYQYFESMTEAEKKRLPPYILLKWLAFTDDRERAQMLALSANQNIFNLYRYPELCYSLLCTSGTKSTEFYKWRKPRKVAIKRPITVKLLMEYYKIGTEEARQDSELMNLESMLAIIDELGEWDQTDALKKEFK